MEGASLARSVCQRWLPSAPPAAMLELALEPTSDTRHQLIVVFTVQFVAYHAPGDVINPRFFLEFGLINNRLGPFLFTKQLFRLHVVWNFHVFSTEQQTDKL